MSTVRYSNLCETSESAYLEYTRALITEYELARALLARGGIAASGVGRALIDGVINQDAHGVGGPVDRRTLLGDAISVADNVGRQEHCSCCGGDSVAHDGETSAVVGVQAGKGARVGDGVVPTVVGDGGDIAASDDFDSRRMGSGVVPGGSGGTSGASDHVESCDGPKSTVGGDAQPGSDGDGGEVLSGRHSKKNRAKREKLKLLKAQWRKSAASSADSGIGASVDSVDGPAQAADARQTAGASVPVSGLGGIASEVGTARTVDTRTGVEIEAAQTLAARRVAENKLKILEAKAAAKLVEHRLRALNDKERTLVIDRLAAARLEEKINTSKKRSQDSFKGCDSPIESVGSALSAHEFAFKQQVRKIEAQKVENRYKDEQLKKFYQYASPDVRQMVAEIPEPYIPTDEEMEAEDLDQSPEPTDEEMEAEAARYFS